jgi:flagellar assembly protein FliH
LSRIIRNVFQQQDEKDIKIVPMRRLIAQGEEETEYEQLPQITQEQILQERDQLLAQAREQIALEKSQIESHKAEQLQVIEELKALWQDEKKELEHNAYEEGFAQGYEAGIAKATSDMAQTLQTANEALFAAKENATRYIESQEAIILELALTAAGRILGKTLERDDAEFTAIIKQGLKEAREMKEVKIYVSPEYYQVVSKNYEELSEMFPTDVPFMIFVNEDLTNTDSYIETNQGRIVVSIDTQLNELRLKLREILDSKE